MAVGDDASPLETDMIEDIMGVAELELRSEAAAVVDPPPPVPPLPFPDSVELAGELVATPLVVDDGAVGPEDEAVKVSAVMEGRLVDPSVGNCFATATLIQKQKMSMARAFEPIEYTIAASVWCSSYGRVCVRGKEGQTGREKEKR